MKKLSFRARATLLTAACLAVTCVFMYLSLLWLADAQIVQAVEVGPIDAVDIYTEIGEAFLKPSEKDKSNLNSSDEIAVGEDVQKADAEAKELFGSLAQSGLRKFQWMGIVIMILITGLGSIIAWFVSGVSTAPVKQLSQKLESVDARKMNLDVSEFSAGDELSKLANSFSKMMERIRSPFEREKRFSAAAAHELKTPLAVMRSSIDVLELSEEPTVEEYREAMKDIETQVDRLTALITDLLSFTKVGKPEFIHRIEVDHLVDELLEELSVRYQKIKINKQLMPVQLNANQSLLERSIYNLLDNAAKYSPSNSTVSVKLFQEGNFCVFKVTDEGCGISPESAEHIFEPFYREDPSRNRSIAGVGLGLSFVKEFADAYGGRISCEPVCPHGTVFTLSLPIISADIECQ